MSETSRDDVLSVFGGLDDATIATIIATGANMADLKAARDWVSSDAAHTNNQSALPPGPVGRVVDIIERNRHVGSTLE
jgi:hypothetical protein